MIGAGAIAARLDRLPPPRAWRLVALISLGGCFEFYDLMMTAYLSPGLVRAGIFHAGPAGLFGQDDQASFAAATFLGLWLGALACSGLADRFGRRAIFTASLLWYSAATLAMAAAGHAVSICAWRLVAGIGVGVELVTIDAYLGELVPPAIRGRAFAVSQAIQFTAVPLVALACWLLIPLAPFGVAGWRWVPILGASAAAVVWLIRARLPESPRWLAGRGRFAEAEAILDRLQAPAAPSLPRAPPGGPVVGTKAGGIFSFPLRRQTIFLAVFNFAQAIGFYGFSNWAPSLIAAQGHEVIRSLGYAVVIALAWPLGPLLFAGLADRFERKHQIIAAALATSVLGLIFARQSAAGAIIAAGVAITLVNTWLSLAFHAYQAELFPTAIRARAVGFVYAWSRLSTVLSSFAIAFLLRRFGEGAVFVFIALAMAVVVASVGIFGPRTRGLSLEVISG